MQTGAAGLDRVKGILLSRLNLKYKRGSANRAKQAEVAEPAQDEGTEEDEGPAVDEESSTDEQPLEDATPPRHESLAKEKGPAKGEEPPKDARNSWDIETVELSELLGSLDKEDSDINDKCIIKAEVYNKGKKDEQYGMRCKSRQPCNSLSILTSVALFFVFTVLDKATRAELAGLKVMRKSKINAYNDCKKIYLKSLEENKNKPSS